MNRRMLLWWGVGCMVVAVALGVWIVTSGDHPLAIDDWWHEVVTGFRTDALVGFALAMDRVGGGWVAVLVIPLLVIVALLLARRWRAAVFAALCFASSAAAVQLLKQLFGRARPDEMLVSSDFGSFPSGHTANAATIALVLWVLFPRVWIVIAGIVWVVFMALSRTVLSVHWFTDTVGGALVGAGVALLLAAWLLPWIRVARTPEVPADRLSDAPTI